MFEPEDERHFALLLPNVHSEDCLVATRTLVQCNAIVLYPLKWMLKLVNKIIHLAAYDHRMFEKNFGFCFLSSSRKEGFGPLNNP